MSEIPEPVTSITLIFFSGGFSKFIDFKKMINYYIQKMILNST